MRCQSCDCQNPDAAKFCDACGTPLPLGCPACGAPNRTNAKFCNACGVALDQHTKPKVAPSDEAAGAPPVAFALGTAVEPQAVPEGERKDGDSPFRGQYSDWPEPLKQITLSLLGAIKVRFWHIADVPLVLTNVCFEGKNGHDAVATPFPLMTPSRHRDRLFRREIQALNHRHN